MLWKKIKNLIARRPTESVLAVVILTVSLLVAFSQLRETGSPVKANEEIPLIGQQETPSVLKESWRADDFQGH